MFTKIWYKLVVGILMINPNQLRAEMITIISDIKYDLVLAQKPIISNQIQACWDRHWTNHIWGRLHQELLKKGFEVVFFDSSVTPEKLLKSIGQSKYVLDARGNTNQYVLFWYNLGLDLSKKLIILAWEPRIFCPMLWDSKFHEKFYRMLVWHDRYVKQDVDRKKYFLFRYPVYTNFTLDIKSLIDFEQKKLQCLVAGNKRTTYRAGQEPKDSDYFDLYQERLKYIHFCEQNNLSFDLYGRGWSNLQKSYRGSIPHLEKSKILGQYKFCICYESSREMGYVTEKIFDCYRAGCVPVYYGAYNIAELIPVGCYINRADFASDQALYDYLITINQDQYLTYLKNIQAFLLNGAQLFSSESFVKSILSAIN